MSGAALSLSIVVAIALAALASWVAYQLRRVVPLRLQRLEDALRVYNSANASLGRQLAETEEALRALRGASAPAAAPFAQQMQLAEAMAAAAPSSSAAGAPAPGLSAAERYEVPEPEFSEAELRLAQLIKSRLSTLRLN
jgi:hypothetical protein